MTDDTYDDIINLPHHTSPHHPPMTMTQRGALFAPFAALTGLGDVMDQSAHAAIEEAFAVGAQREFDPDLYLPDPPTI